MELGVSEVREVDKSKVVDPDILVINGQLAKTEQTATEQMKAGDFYFVDTVDTRTAQTVFDEAGQFRTDIEIGESEVPENVRMIVGRRLERLDENEKLALTAAAVIGRSFSFKLLTAICEIDIDELLTIVEKAQQMGIVVASSDAPEKPFTFSHELVRQTLLAGISAPRRQHLHAGVADAIARLHPDAVNERAGDIADHLIKAGSFAEEDRSIV